MQGFSQLQIRAISVLLAALIIGLGIKYWQDNQPLPEADPVLEKRFSVIADSLNLAESSQQESKATKITSGQNVKIRINSASIAELQTLPGIGPVLGERIIKFRDDYGDFQSVEDLLKVKGIGRNTLEKLSKLIILD